MALPSLHQPSPTQKRWTHATIQFRSKAWARGSIARKRYRPVLLKRLAAKREAEAIARTESREETTAAAAKALSSGDQGTALKLLLQELERQRLAVDAMSVTIADLERNQSVGAVERSAAAELVKQHTVA